MVPKAGKFSVRPFNKERGVTKGDPVYPMISNILVDAVVRAVLLEVCDSQEAHHGFGWAVGDHNILFYADFGRIAGRNMIWAQTALTSMVRMFERVGLHINLSKTKSMVFMSGFIWGHR